MKIETKKDLESVIKLCRKMGVNTIEVDGIKLSLGDAPQKLKTAANTAEAIEEPIYSEEDMLLWSSSGQN